jgi:hypothetical protein
VAKYLWEVFVAGRDKKKRGKSSPIKDLPKGMKVVTDSGGDLDDVEKHFEKAYGKTMLYLKGGEDARIAFLAVPQDFVRFGEHRVQSETDRKNFQLLPCTAVGGKKKKCIVCRLMPDVPISQAAHVPVYDYGTETVRLFRATSIVMKELVRLFKRRRKRWFKRQWTLEREGDMLDTVYSFYDEEERVGKETDDVDIPDSGQILLDQLKVAIDRIGFSADEDEDDYDDDEEFDYDDDDDDDEDNDDDDDDDEDDDEDELLPSRRKTKTKITSSNRDRNRDKKKSKTKRNRRSMA